MQHFSKKELQYINDTDFLLTKSIITQKIYDQLASVEQSLKEQIKLQDFPDKVFRRTGKISKGEHYKGLPYLILDYPRIFNKEDIFAFRTMFWWGHFFSATLHLGGEHWREYRELLIGRRSFLSGRSWYICTNQSPWEYHYETDNYKCWDNLKENEQLSLLQTHPFLKLSKNWKLNDTTTFTAKALEAFAQAMEMIKPD